LRIADEPEIRSRLAVVLGEVSLALVDARTLATASRVHPMSLRTLDAIHLATAFLLGKELAGFVSYDKRLFDAATLIGFQALRPGAPPLSQA
jgi:predicted nucleic acid-binding protein